FGPLKMKKDCGYGGAPDCTWSTTSPPSGLRAPSTPPLFVTAPVLASRNHTFCSAMAATRLPAAYGTSATMGAVNSGGFCQRWVVPVHPEPLVTHANTWVRLPAPVKAMNIRLPSGLKTDGGASVGMGLELAISWMTSALSSTPFV